MSASVRERAVPHMTHGAVRQNATRGRDWDPARGYGQIAGAVALLRGAGGPAAKSAPLLSLSTQPVCLRCPAVVFDRVGAGIAPSEQLAVVP